jgi:chaperone BCS1
VRVGFKNASKKQAEEIFLRMYVDLPSTGQTLLEQMEETEKKAAQPTTSDNNNTAHLHDLAKKFADLIPDHDFSPADLQDYLLIHKKDAAKAVEALPQWMEETLDERRRKEEEKEVERELKKEAKLEERRKFREEIKAAVQETKDGQEGDGEEDSQTNEAEDAKNEEYSEARE